MNKHFDYLVVGAGLFGAVFSREMNKRGRSCLVIDKREHVAGNIYTSLKRGIHVHEYGAHIFHTSNRKVWEYINAFADFNHFVNSPMAIYKGEIYNLPFNMNTFSKLWGVKTPDEAKARIKEQINDLSIDVPQNLEEQALSLAGRDVYEKLIKGYTEKQWGRDCRELPAFIIKRVPLRFTYDNNYFTDRYQGIPVGGYTAVVEKMLEGIEVRLNTDYREFDRQQKEAASQKEDYISYDKVLYTGMIDEYFDYCLGNLEYRSLRFEKEDMPEQENYQGNAVINYTEREIPYTRIIEHKHFEFGQGEGTVITREYPAAWKPGDEPYYPVNDERNNGLFARYQELAKKEKGVLFGGRLGQYRYYDMDKVIEAALAMVQEESEK
ncbi:UDP-galactopyranose mutase [Lachnospiraceae bacterium]|jgi:UDP-galactopyranose mutase|nr:UDP-galactopyranose mutase [Lachnospiraceae bacterium]GFI17041.1 UDP-galactopyranose mutase [Lachnospiraceae bacterium]GFI69312.1 UDP-galactopyranose mutase [Lachnospiraceae bacterium]